MQGTTQRLTPRTPPPRTPKVPIPFKFTIVRPKKSGLFSPRKKGGLFITELRRGGKFKAIGRSGSPEQALGIGKMAARGTLGASIRVKTPGGKFLRFTPGEEFRLGQGGRNANILTQRSTARLSSAGERKEILFARLGKVRI
jgi:hypothetical protein